jgi:uncharacterized membrane protein YgdD (TMEM256/DUF423 family)
MASVWHQVAGVNGAAAIGLSAFGSHGLPKVLEKQGHDQKQVAKSQRIWDTAARMHLVHSVMLAIVPTLKRPGPTGILLASGTALFCGPCYLLAADPTQFADQSKMAPIGGFVLIGGWLSMIF